MINKTYLYGLSAMLLASCTVGPDYKRPEFYSSDEIRRSLSLQNTAGQNVSLDWYTRFNDPLLNRLIAQGLLESPTVGSAVERLRQARQSLRINAAQFLPTLNVDGSYHKVSDSVAYGIPVSTDYYQAGLDAGWEIDIWGGGRRLTESSYALVQVAASQLDNVKLSLTAEIAADYINMRRAQEQLRISKHNLKLQRDIYELVNEKHKVGLADDIALNQSRYIVEKTAALIPSLEAQEQAYQNALTILVGKLPGEFQEPLGESQSNIVQRQFDFNLQNLYELPADVIRNRPDVRVAERQLAAQNAKIGQAVAEMFPSVSLSGFLGWQSRNLGSLIGSDTDMYSISPAVNLPLFHFGRLVNNVELQKSATREQVLLYKNSILNAAAEIRNAMVTLDKEYQTNNSSRAAVTAQKQVAGLTLDKYKQGLIDFSDVLTSQQDLLQSQNALIASNAAIYEDIISFYKAVGGGYLPPEPPVRRNQMSGVPKGCRK